MSMANVLFFMNRYYMLCAAVYVSIPRWQYLHWEGWTGLTASLLAQAILQLRIYALYMGNKKILAFMLAAYAIQSALSAWIMANDLAQFVISVMSFAGQDSCVSSSENPRIYVFYTPLMVFDGVLCILALVRGVQEAKMKGSVFHRGQSLMEILVRDSILYFLVIGLTYLVCILSLRFESPSLIDSSTGFALAMSNILANRVLFNLREAGLEILPLYSDNHY
ncbi:hypothetical protein GALMADRAFT_232246 [Galerina marginata CBS 339.88]|uniref:Uncharacterized protein n=1 Tax=Galerina marginata (strain CBS 339.88) TaxID=685588 RepID=A0A067SH44_GALM3|nr:hypothetical protein GALMADRAFT_232246 [Galerina marginata CBS 339.88]